MRQAWIVDKKRIEIREVPKPKPGKGEILVRIAFNAICGSEFPAYLGIATGLPHYLGILNYPFGPFGHEGSGTVEEIGEGVRGFTPGDRVVGVGGYADYCVVPEDGAITKIPEGISLRDASLAAMALEGDFAVRILQVKPAESVLIAGMGPGGMFVLESLRERGVSLVIAADLLDGRLHLAKELGATDILRADRKDFLERVQEVSRGGVDVAIDTTGLPVSIKNMFKVVKRFGKVGLFGRALYRLDDFEIEDIFHKFLTVYGLKCHPTAYTPANMGRMLERIKSGSIHAEKLISHEYPLSEINEAFEMAAVSKKGMKIVVNCLK